MARHRLKHAALLASAFSVACSSGEGRPPPPAEVGELPEGLVGLMSRASAGGGGLAAPEPIAGEEEGATLDPLLLNELDVTAHLEGQLRNIVLQHDTSQNMGFSTSWLQGGYLDVAVAAETGEGAGMLLFTLQGGADHPLLTNGRWSYADEMLNTTAGSPTYTYVGSCAGPELGDYPFEDPPIDYELTLEPTPDPERVAIDVSAHFENDGYVDGRVELRLPD